jgi:hypothetical protein
VRNAIVGLGCALVFISGCAGRQHVGASAAKPTPVPSNAPSSASSSASSIVPPAALSLMSAVESLSAPEEIPVSTPPSVVVGPRCRASQLTADLEDIEQAGDSDYGWLVVRDVSSAACQLSGSIDFVGLSSTGTEDTVRATSAVAGGLLLSPRAAPVPNEALPPSGEHVGYLLAISSDSTTIGPSPGADCPGVDEIVPTTWRLDIDGTGSISTRNGRPDSTSVFSHLQVCQGQLITYSQVTGEPN